MGPDSHPDSHVLSASRRDDAGAGCRNRLGDGCRHHPCRLLYVLPLPGRGLGRRREAGHGSRRPIGRGVSYVWPSVVWAQPLCHHAVVSTGHRYVIAMLPLYAVCVVRHICRTRRSACEIKVLLNFTVLDILLLLCCMLMANLPLLRSSLMRYGWLNYFGHD